MRTLINLIRGKKVPEALSILHYLPHKGTRPVEITLQSAVHNLMDQNRDARFREEELVVSDARVDEGPMFKRFQPVSRGRAHSIKKRTSHITVVVSTTGRDAA